MIDKMLLTSAFQKLGPDRVERGLKAETHDWSRCFLALCYGRSGELWHDVLRITPTDATGPSMEVPTLACAITFRLTDGEVEEVVRAFDHEHGAFQALASEWLEAVPEQVTA